MADEDNKVMYMFLNGVLLKELDLIAIDQKFREEYK